MTPCAETGIVWKPCQASPVRQPQASTDGRRADQCGQHSSPPDAGLRRRLHPLARVRISAGPPDDAGRHPRRRNPAALPRERSAAFGHQHADRSRHRCRSATPLLDPAAAASDPARAAREAAPRSNGPSSVRAARFVWRGRRGVVPARRRSSRRTGTRILPMFADARGDQETGRAHHVHSPPGHAQAPVRSYACLDQIHMLNEIAFREEQAAVAVVRVGLRRQVWQASAIAVLLGVTVAGSRSATPAGSSGGFEQPRKDTAQRDELERPLQETDGGAGGRAPPHRPRAARRSRPGARRDQARARPRRTRRQPPAAGPARRGPRHGGRRLDPSASCRASSIR